MLSTQMIHDRRIQPRSNLLRPTSHFPKVAGAEEVEVERVTVRRRIGLGRNAGQWADGLARALEMIATVLNLLVDVLRLEHFVKVLHADLATGTRVVGRVVLPGLGVDAPARAVPLLAQRVVEAEAADQDDLLASFAESGHLRVRVPSVDVAGVVPTQDLSELLVGGFAGALPFHGDDDRFAGVLVEELEDRVGEVAEVLWSGEGDGEHGMNEDQAIVVWVIGAGGLYPNVEEAHPILELLFRGDGLASYRRQGIVMRGRVVGAWNGQG